jgi:hypothetical protein
LKAIVAFRTALKEEVDIEGINRLLVSTIEKTVQPMQVFLLLRKTPAEKRKERLPA